MEKKTCYYTQVFIEGKEIDTLGPSMAMTDKDVIKAAAKKANELAREHGKPVSLAIRRYWDECPAFKVEGLRHKSAMGRTVFDYLVIDLDTQSVVSDTAKARRDSLLESVMKK